jgi:hypothetical protein
MKNIPREASLQMKDRIVQQLFGQQVGGMQSPSMPMQNNQAMMQTAPMQTPSFGGGYQGMNPIAMAQMLRGRIGGFGLGRPPMNVGLNPYQQPFNVGLNPMAGRGFGINPNTIRSSYADFLSSLDKG